MYISKIRATIFFIVHITFCNISFSQLDSLRLELFKQENDKIFLYEVICPNNKIDSSITIRRNQPNHLKVFSYLNYLLEENDANNINELQEIYDEQISMFEKEWGKLYKENFYSCEAANNQFNILKGFEIVLKSLDIKDKELEPQEIFNLYCSNYELNWKYFKEINPRVNLLYEFKVYSEQFRELNSKAWFAGTTPFGPWDPYIDEIGIFFINTLKSCDWSLGLDDERNKFIWNSRKILNQVESSEIVYHFMNNYEVMKENDLLYIIFEYAENQTFEDFTRFLSKQLTCEHEAYNTMFGNAREHYLSMLMRNTNNTEWIKDELFKELSKQNKYAIDLLKNFPDKTVLKKLKREKRRIRIDKEIKNEIKSTIKIIEMKIAAANNA